MEAMLAHLGAMLGYVGPAGRHLGATWRQDEAQERQDEPRWRTGAPRRGKIAELRRRELSQGGRGPRSEQQPPGLHPHKNPELGLQNWDSRLRLQLELDLENWILENWKTGRLGLRLYIVHATVPSGTVADNIGNCPIVFKH